MVDSVRTSWDEVYKVSGDPTIGPAEMVHHRIEEMRLRRVLSLEGR